MDREQRVKAAAGYWIMNWQQTRVNITLLVILSVQSGPRSLISEYRKRIKMCDQHECHISHTEESEYSIL